MRCQGFLSVVLGFTPRPIPEPESSAVVPPAPRVVRYAVKNLVANIRVLEADANELDKILRREPDRKPTRIDRRVTEISDANAGDAQPVLECVERGDRFAKGLACPIPGIGPHSGVDINSPVAWVNPIAWLEEANTMRATP